MGLIQGLEFKDDPKKIVEAALEEGLVLIPAGNNTIRFIPPLIINKVNIDEMIRLLDIILSTFNL